MSDKDFPSAEELVRRILAGDQSAEALMVNKYQRGLKLVLFRQGGASLIEDVCQETWRVVLEKVRANAIREPAKLSAFIVQIGRNQLIMHNRKLRKTEEYDHEVEVIPGKHDPSSDYEQMRLREMVSQALLSLDTDRDREVLRRFYLSEEEKSKICADLELTPEHFSRVLYRAKARFRALLETEKHGVQF